MTQCAEVCAGLDPWGVSIFFWQITYASNTGLFDGLLKSITA